MEVPDEHSVIGPDHQIAAPVPPRRRGLRIFVWILFLLVLLALALFFVFTTTRKPKRRPRNPPRRGSPLRPRRLKRATSAFTSTPSARSPGLYRFDYQPGDRADRCRALSGGSSGSEGRSAGRYRSASLPRHAFAGARGARARPECARASTDGPGHATVPRGRATPLQSKSWMTRKSLCCRTRAQ